MSNPVCPNLAKFIFEETEDFFRDGRILHSEGTYVQIEGPSFSTQAESRLYKSWGGSVIGMTNFTEARLSMEAEIAYAPLCMVTDYDSWNMSMHKFDIKDIIKNLKENSSLAQKILLKLCTEFSKKNLTSASHMSLKNSLITDLKYVSKDTFKEVEIIISKYKNS